MVDMQPAARADDGAWLWEPAFFALTPTLLCQLSGSIF
jgi:hypothetical protein